MDTATTFPFADGEYRFWLPLPQIFEVQRKCGDGTTETSPLVIEERLRAAISVDDKGEFCFTGGGSAMVADVREVLRCGLIGGNSGMVDGQEVEVGPMKAKELCDNYVYPARPLSEGVVQAWKVLHAAIHGIKLEASKKKPVAEAPKTPKTPKAPKKRASPKAK